jgi:hypothetical protein
MPITYSEGIKRPCNSSGRELLTFMREREMKNDWQQRFTTLPAGPFHLQLLKFAFDSHRCGLKKKVIEAISTVIIPSYNLNNYLYLYVQMLFFMHQEGGQPFSSSFGLRT